MTVTLEMIRKAARKAKACKAQFKPFCKAIRDGNDTLAWQIVLGNKHWLKSENIPLPGNLEELAEEVGKTFYDNGNIHDIIDYKNNELHGLWLSFYEDGELYSSESFKNGYKHGLTLLFGKSGYLMEMAMWENGAKHGITKTYHADTKQLATKTTWKNGQLNGVHVSYFPDGSLREVCHYRINLRHGPRKVYENNGDLIIDEYWENGVLKLRKG